MGFWSGKLAPQLYQGWVAESIWNLLKAPGGFIQQHTGLWPLLQSLLRGAVAQQLRIPPQAALGSGRNLSGEHRKNTKLSLPQK